MTTRRESLREEFRKLRIEPLRGFLEHRVPAPVVEAQSRVRDKLSGSLRRLGQHQDIVAPMHDQGRHAHLSQSRRTDCRIRSATFRSRGGSPRDTSCCRRASSRTRPPLVTCRSSCGETARRRRCGWAVRRCANPPSPHCPGRLPLALRQAGSSGRQVPPARRRRDPSGIAVRCVRRATSRRAQVARALVPRTLPPLRPTSTAPRRRLHRGAYPKGRVPAGHRRQCGTPRAPGRRPARQST